MAVEKTREFWRVSSGRRILELPEIGRSGLDLETKAVTRIYFCGFIRRKNRTKRNVMDRRIRK